MLDTVSGGKVQPKCTRQDAVVHLLKCKLHDVAICVVASVSMSQRRFPTTCTESTEAIRFGCKALASVWKPVADFKQNWELKLTGGLQFAFCEDENAAPPWEALIDIENVNSVVI